MLSKEIYGALGRVLARAKMMTTLTRIHGGNIPLTSLDDRSGSGTPLTATAAITAGTSRPATITDTGFVHDSCRQRKAVGLVPRYPRAARCNS